MSRHIVTEATTTPGGFRGRDDGAAIGSRAAVARAAGAARAPFGVTAPPTRPGPGPICAPVQAARP